MYKFISIVFICILFNANLVAQIIFPCFSIIESTNENAELEDGAIIWLVNKFVFEDQLEGIWIDGIRHQATLDNSIQFQEKTIMRAFFNCAYDFERYEDTGQFLAIPIQMASGQINYLVGDAGSAYYYLIYKGYDYLMMNCEGEDACQADYFKQAKFDTSQITIKLEPDLPTVEIDSAEFETITEQILVQDARTELVIKPPVFVNQEHIYYTGDSLVCLGEPFTQQLISDSVLIHDAYQIYTVIPAVYETVSEQVLVKEAHTLIDTFYVNSFDTTITEILLPQHTSYIWPDNLEPCQSLNPFDCIEMDSILVDSVAVTLNIETTEPCPDDYISCGRLCFSFTVAPSSYEVITREILVEPSVVSSETVPAVYHHFVRKDITISSNTPDSCLVQVYDTINQVILDVPALINTIEIPALYSTRSFERLASDLQYNKTVVSFDTTFTKIDFDQVPAQGLNPIICEPILIEPLKALIIEKLIEFEYLSEPVTFGSEIFWDAIFRVQQDNHLRIGGLDRITLHMLGIG